MKFQTHTQNNATQQQTLAERRQWEAMIVCLCLCATDHAQKEIQSFHHPWPVNSQRINPIHTTDYTYLEYIIYWQRDTHWPRYRVFLLIAQFSLMKNPKKKLNFLSKNLIQRRLFFVSPFFSSKNVTLFKLLIKLQFHNLKSVIGAIVGYWVHTHTRHWNFTMSHQEKK